MADDFGSDTLPNLALGSWIYRQDEIGMGLDVDKARRHGEAVGIDDLIGLPGQARTERGNAASADGDITGAAGPSTSIDHSAVADQNIPRHTSLRRASLLRNSMT